jgi:hypothetical protein
MLSNCLFFPTGSVVHFLLGLALSHHSRNMTDFRLTRWRTSVESRSQTCLQGELRCVLTVLQPFLVESAFFFHDLLHDNQLGVFMVTECTFRLVQYTWHWYQVLPPFRNSRSISLFSVLFSGISPKQLASHLHLGGMY